ETFEPALRVFESRDRQDLHVKIKNPAHEVTILRLIVADGSGCFTTTDGYIVPHGRRRKELGDLFNGHRKVGVGHKEVVTRRRQHTCAHGCPLALSHFVYYSQIRT